MTIERLPRPLPRYQKRGPIEAYPDATLLAGSPPLPRYQKRGPIEANYTDAIAQRVGHLPRYQKRGPIEAFLRRPQQRRQLLPSALPKARPH